MIHLKVNQIDMRNNQLINPKVDLLKTDLRKRCKMEVESYEERRTNMESYPTLEKKSCPTCNVW